MEALLNFSLQVLDVLPNHSNLSSLIPNVEELQDSHETRLLIVQWWVGIVELLVFLIGTPANLIVLCLALWKTGASTQFQPPSRKANITKYLVVSMTSADLLFCSIHAPMFYASYNLDVDHSAVPCLTLFAVTHLSTVASSLSLLLISIDKFLHLRHPLHYAVYVTTKRGVITVVICWLISIGWSLLFIFGSFMEYNERCDVRLTDKTIYIVFAVGFFVIPTMISLIISVYVAVIVFKSRVRLRRRMLKRGHRDGTGVPAGNAHVSYSSNTTFRVTSNTMRRTSTWTSSRKSQVSSSPQRGMMGSVFNGSGLVISLQSDLDLRARSKSDLGRSSAILGGRSSPKSLAIATSKRNAIKCYSYGAAGTTTKPPPPTQTEKSASAGSLARYIQKRASSPLSSSPKMTVKRRNSSIPFSNTTRASFLGRANSIMTAIVQAHSNGKHQFRRIGFVFTTTIYSALTVLPYRLCFIVWNLSTMNNGKEASRDVEPPNDGRLAETIYFCLFALMALNAAGNPFITILTQRQYSKKLAKLWTRLVEKMKRKSQ